MPATIPRVLGISMFDSSRGVAVGAAAVTGNPALSGVLVKDPGSPTWVAIDPLQFYPDLPPGFAFFSAVHAIPGTSICIIGGSVLPGGGGASVYRSVDYGHTWTRQNSGMPPTFTIFDLDFRSATEGMAACSGNQLRYTASAGLNWSTGILFSLPLLGDLHAIRHVPGTNDFWAIGDHKAVLHFSYPFGATHYYTAQFPGNANESLRGVSVVDEEHAFFTVGTNVNRTPFSSGLFQVLPAITPTPSTLYGIWFFDSTSGWVAGSYNELYRTTDLGAAWHRYACMPTGGGSGLVSRMTFVDTACGFAVGPYTGSPGWIIRYGDIANADISASDTLVDFGMLTCETTADRHIMFTNIGQDTLHIAAGGITLPRGVTLSPPNQLPMSVAPGASGYVTVRWTPAAGQADSLPPGSFMIVTSDDPNHPRWHVRLAGSTAVSRLQTSTTVLTFPPTCVGADAGITVRCTALGTLPPVAMDWLHDSGDDDVRLITPSLPATITGSADLVFRFHPEGPGMRSGVYRLVAGLPECPDTIVFTFTGMGTLPSFRVIDTLVHFGSTCPGMPRERQVLVINTGPDPLVVSSLSHVAGSDLFEPLTILPAPAIAQGDTLVLRLRFAPGATDVGTFTARQLITVQAGSNGCTGTMPLTLDGVSNLADLHIVPGSVDLGQVLVGAQDSVVVTVWNTGTAAIHLTALTLAGTPASISTFGAPMLPMTLEAGGSIQFTVRYAPTRTETVSGLLFLHHDDPCAGSLSVPVLAAGLPPPRYRADAALDLGTQVCPEPLHEAVMVRNDGEGPLVISSFAITGPQRDAFSVVTPPPVTVLHGDSVAIAIAFTALSAGPHAALLTIHHNDPSVGFSSTVALRARREATAHRIGGDTTTVLGGCILQPTTRRLFVHNTGAVPLTLASATITAGVAELALVPLMLPATIAVGDSLPLDVVFTATSTTPITGGLVLLMEPCHQSTLVSLHGTGERSTPLATPGEVDFGTLQTGATETRQVTIRNMHGAPMRIASIAILPPAPGLSLHTPPALPVDLAPDAAMPLDLEYAPLEIGSLSTRLRVITSLPCSDTLLIAIRGNATSSGLALHRSDLHVDLDPCAMSQRCDTVELANNAIIPLTVTDISIDRTGGPFHVTIPGATPVMIGPGDRVLLTICVDPTFTGDMHATVRVTSTDPMHPVIDLPMSAHRDSSHVTAMPDTLDFGALPPCIQDSVLRLSLCNTGTITEIIRGDAAPAPFFLEPDQPLTLAPGETRSVTVRYAPPAGFAHEATLWVATERCGWRIPVVVRGTRQVRTATASPMELGYMGVAVGSSQSRSTDVRNVLATPLHIAAIVIDPAGPFTPGVKPPLTVDAGRSASIGFRFTPVVQGPVSAVASIITDAPCTDTLRITLTGTGIDHGPAFQGTEIRFGATAQCEAPVRTDTLVNTGITTCTLTASTVTGVGASSYTILDPVSSDEALPAGARRVFTIRFAPGAGVDGNETATLSIATTDALQPVIDLPIIGLREMQRTPADRTVTIGPIATATATSVVVTLTNGGSRSVTYNAAELPPGATLTPPLPIRVPSHGSIDIQLVVPPQTAGAFTVRATLHVTSPCVDSTRVTITGTAVGGVQQTDASFGLTAHCLTQRRTIQFHNGEGAPVTILSITTAGPGAARFVIESPTVFPFTVAAGADASITIAWQPPTSPGMDTAMCVTTLRVNGIEGEVRSMLLGEGTPAMLTTAVLPVDVGEGVVGTAVQTRVVLMNPSPFTIQVGAIAAAAMVVRGSTPPLPASIPAGGTIIIDAEWVPRAAGPWRDSLVVVEVAPCDARLAFEVHGRGLPADVLRTDLSIPVIEGHVDEHIRIPIRSTRDLAAAGARSWQGAIRFNRTMLFPLHVVTANTLSQDMTVTQSYDHRTGTLTVSATGAAVRGGTGSLIEVEALVLLGDAIESPIHLQPGFDFTSGSASVQTLADGVFHLVGYCMGGGSRLVRVAGAYGLQQNRPNPFNPETEIVYELAQDGPTRLAVHDALGREVAVLVDAMQTAGRHSVHFTAGNLASGVYLYRLISGPFSDTRRMVLVR